MITLLPVRSFVRSMEFLDERRLKKQILEVGQLLYIVTGQDIIPPKQKTVVPLDINFPYWDRHPSIQMWKGHEEWLKLYLACAIGEWCFRGYFSTIPVLPYDTSNQCPPDWLGYEPLHYSHRCRLVSKFPQHYGQFWRDENLDLNTPYFWPTLNGFTVTQTEERSSA